MQPRSCAGKKIKECVAKYMVIVEDIKQRTDLSLDLRKYVEAMQYSLSGNVIWSLLCPRYHQGANYNDFQLSLLKNRVGKSRLDSDAKFDLAFSSQPRNSTNGSSGVKAVNKVDNLNSDKGHQGENRHDTINKSARKRTIDDDEIQGVRIGKPRLEIQTKEINDTELDWNLAELGDEVGNICHVNYIRVCFAD